MSSVDSTPTTSPIITIPIEIPATAPDPSPSLSQPLLGAGVIDGVMVTVDLS